MDSTEVNNASTIACTAQPRHVGGVREKRVAFVVRMTYANTVFTKRNGLSIRPLASSVRRKSSCLLSVKDGESTNSMGVDMNRETSPKETSSQNMSEDFACPA
jgi:hypothetical protein